MKAIKFEIGRMPILILGMALSFTQCTELTGLDDEPVQENGLSESEINGIRFMREEEKLARDVYIFLYEEHGLRPHLNISKSEQVHMDAIKHLIDTFNIEDPVGDNPEGVFENEELQLMYDELIEKGSESPEEALKVGALIEEVDIIDLQKEIEDHGENEEVVRVFTNLCRASENHLRAFVRVLAVRGVEYNPVKLDQEEFDRILGE